MKAKRPITPAWVGEWPIPKTIKLPGLKIRVKRVPTADLEEHGSTCGIWLYTTPNSALILVNKDVPLEVQRYILWHELQHACVEAVDVMIEKFPERVQTISMATLAGLKTKEGVADGARTENPAGITTTPVESGGSSDTQRVVERVD